ncbi:hypothetical protein SAMN05216388_101531 [Halorientalis persicus]|jgi:hypothetical protein|uniref:Uncharacterized protein n=1 Tax=Halorientalis persicus TaxID=1367881 RepID=A0A1H8QYZ4_9EURY|nr:hypothetical protein [Halorientalis persicus]SEO59560.1 hypothetical protein SAMN05216388_101531 [Halorientalis persicus]
METRLHSGLLFVLYQLSLMVGIALMPVAFVTSRLGVTLPVHRMVDRLGAAYDQSSDGE